MQIINNPISSQTTYNIDKKLGLELHREDFGSNFTSTNNGVKGNWVVQKFDSTTNKCLSTAQESVYLSKVKRKLSGRTGKNPLMVETSNRFKCLSDCEDTKILKSIDSASALDCYSSHNLTQKHQKGCKGLKTKKNDEKNVSD